MIIHNSLDNFISPTSRAVTLGTFDGVHLGHQKILKRLKEVAKKIQGESVVITFWPHPRLLLDPNNNSVQLLNTFDEKVALLRQQEIDHLVVIPFTKEFSQLTSQDFISKILIDKIKTTKLVIGYDHRFGKDRGGSIEELKNNHLKYGFEVEEISAQDIDNVTISSTIIRKSLLNGDILTASRFLGRPYSIEGKIVFGNKIGRELGFPTANIEVESANKLIPSNGIYAVTVAFDSQILKGMLYIGRRPTIESGERVIEVNLFDFDKVIYGGTLKIYFHSFLRKDKKFEDLVALKEQLFLDKQKADDILKDILPATKEI